MNLKIKSAIRRKINEDLHEIGRQYWEDIPLQDMFAAFEKNGYFVLQEDATPWAGLLCGEKGTFNAKIGLKENDTYLFIDNAGFCFTWYKMETGRYEIVAYVS